MKRALLLLSLLSSSFSFAQSVLLDRVVVLVDGEPILRSQILERVQTRELPDSVEARAQLFIDSRDELVAERLISHEMKRLHVELDPADVTRALAAVAESNKLTVDQLLAEARKRGLSEDAYRALLGNQLMEQRWLYTKLEGKVSELTPDQLALARLKFLEQLRETAVVEVIQ
ncbi:MAG: hypothetical protein ACO1OB_01200 [Archangium sp.]